MILVVCNRWWLCSGLFRFVDLVVLCACWGVLFCLFVFCVGLVNFLFAFVTC